MKINELNKFALTLALLPIIPALLLYKHSKTELALQILVVFWVLAIFCFFNKKFARKFKDTLSVVGAFLGKYIAIIVLAIGYVLAILPTGILMKIVRRDRLRLKKPNVETYWVNQDTKNTDYEYQF